MFQGNNTILVISPVQLMPVTGGGAARILAYIAFLRARNYRVELVTVPHARRAEQQLRKRVDELWIARPGAAVHGRYPASLRRAASHLPEPVKEALRPIKRRMDRMQARAARPTTQAKQTSAGSFLARARDDHFDAFARKIIAERAPVAAIACYAWAARALDNAPPSVLTLIDTIDIQHTRHEIAARAGHALDRIWCTREEEIEELCRARVLMAIQPEELETLRAMCPGRECILVEHAYPVPEVLAPSPPNARTVLFVGNLYEPNVAGIADFIATAWPRVRAAVPEARLLVAGKVCQETPEAKGVEKLGVVPSLDPYYRGAAVVINPVPFGSGLKIKSIEAITQGRCLVATEAGLLGLPPEAKAACFCAPVDDMAGIIVDLLAHPEKRAQAEQRARDFAQVYYAPARIYAQLLAALLRHAGAAPE